jgi:hypothetical protein
MKTFFRVAGVIYLILMVPYWLAVWTNSVPPPEAFRKALEAADDFDATARLSFMESSSRLFTEPWQVLVTFGMFLSVAVILFCWQEKGRKGKRLRPAELIWLFRRKDQKGKMYTIQH